MPGRRTTSKIKNVVGGGEGFLEEERGREVELKGGLFERSV